MICLWMICVRSAGRSASIQILNTHDLIQIYHKRSFGPGIILQEEIVMTIKEIAQLAGVSSAAVSRYLNGGYVREEKKEQQNG